MITQAGWARKSHWISGVDPCIVPGKLPLTLNSRFEIFDVSEINEIDHSITIYFMIRIYWNDPGLSYKNKSL